MKKGSCTWRGRRHRPFGWPSCAGWSATPERRADSARFHLQRRPALRRTRFGFEAGSHAEGCRPHLLPEHGAGLLPRRHRFREVQGVPTVLNAELVAGEPRHCAPISVDRVRAQRRHRRGRPGLGVASEGAVDSIQLVARKPPTRCASSRSTPESATSVVLTKVLLPEAARLEAFGGRRDADAKLLIGDAALKSRVPRGSDPALRSRAARGSSGRACRWCSRSGPAPRAGRDGLAEPRTHSSPFGRVARADPEKLAFEAGLERYPIPPASSRAT